MDKRISVVIPVFNEERTISSIVEIVRSWGQAHEIIIVDDGSTDKTLEALSQFKKSITTLTFKRNHGKGFAVAKGISESHGELILFLDGDLVGLTHRDLDLLISPCLSDEADMVIGIARFWRVGSFAPFDDLSGERVVKRENVWRYLQKMQRVGYGLELMLNEIHEQKRITRVRLPHVFILGKFEKQSVPQALQIYLKEAKELLAQTLSSQAKEMTPQANKTFTSIQRYLKHALKSLQ